MMKKFVCIIIACALIFSLSGCELIGYVAWFALPHPVYDELNTYDNFWYYKSDFETVRDIVVKNGYGRYHMSMSDGSLSKLYQGEESSDFYYADVELKDDECQSVINIVSNSYCDSIHYVFYFNEDGKDYIFFSEEQGCGVVYTDDIDAFLATRNRDFYYSWLSDEWYAVYY